MIIRIRSSIALKMTLLVLGGTSLVFALVLAYSYYYSKNIILEEAESRTRNLTCSVAGRIEQEFRAVAKIPTGLAVVLETTLFEEGTLLPLMQRIVEDNREIFGVAVAFEPHALSADRRVYAPYYCKTEDGFKFQQLASPSNNYFQQDWYHIPKVLGAPVWSEPYFDEAGGGIAMCTYSCPFSWRDKNASRKGVRGIVTADISLAWLNELVSSIKVGRKGYCFIISDTGTFIASPRPELIRRESVFSLAEQRGSVAMREVGRAMLREESGFVRIDSALTGEPAFLAFARIPSPGWALGAIFPEAELFAEVSMLHRRTLLLAVVGIMLLLAVSILVARSMAWPLRRMAAATKRVAEGDLDVNFSDIRSHDEIGRLAESFTRMTAGLKERDRIRDTFGRYLTKEVVNRLLESRDGLKLGGESREITMIMSDLRGFTSMTANMMPEDVISFLNRYLGRMVEILVQFQGIVDEIIGDGILAFFGAPEPVEDHPALAVACALKMQVAMEEVNTVNEAEGLPHLEMGVAVNTGRVVVGNIGSEQRAKYGAVGTQVNFTGRMESFALGGQVLVSESTYHRLSNILEVRNVLHVEMKGIQGKINLYDVMGIRGSYNIRLPERDHTPGQLEDRIPATIHRMDKKIIVKKEASAWFTRISMTSGVLISEREIGEWEDLRIELIGDSMESDQGEIYAKVIAVKTVEDKFEVSLRFTSISASAYKILRRSAPKV